MGIIQPSLTADIILRFHNILRERDIELYYKWWHGQHNEITFTNIEKDIIQCVARQSRAVTYKGE